MTSISVSKHAIRAYLNYLTRPAKRRARHTLRDAAQVCDYSPDTMSRARRALIRDGVLTFAPIIDRVRAVELGYIDEEKA